MMRFAELLEAVLEGALACRKGEGLTFETVRSIRRELRGRVAVAAQRCGLSLSQSATDWVADEYLRATVVNGSIELAKLIDERDDVSVAALPVSDRELLRKIFPPDAADFGRKLCE